MTAAPPAAFISVQHATKAYGQHVVLDNVSLDIAKGEFLVLLGPSGCGKTTLLRSIAGFVEIDSGDVVIDGNSVRHMPANQRPVNTVFQNYALFPHLTVADNVAYGPRRARKAAAEVNAIVAEALETVGMASFAARFPNQLSGGQQQRVALARAIANRPKVLLLDEPLGALDLKLRRQMQIELKALQHRLGITFIFVTHDQEEALVMADRIAVMEAGRIAQVASGLDIYHRPSNPYVADFVGEANLIACVTVPGGVALPDGHIWQVDHALPQGQKAFYLLRPEGVAVSREQPAAAAQNAVSASVRDVVFVGNAARLYAALPGGLDLVAQLPALPGSPRYSAGETVILSWPRDAGMVLAS